MTRNEIIGERIREVRETYGKETQAELAKAFGVKREIVSYWERGTRPLRAETLFQIADRYNVSADYLLGRTEDARATGEERFIYERTGLSKEAVASIRGITNDALHSCFLVPDVELLNSFISDCLYGILDRIYDVRLKLLNAEECIATIDLDSKDIPTLVSYYDQLEEVEEALQVSMYRYSKFCEQSALTLLGIPAQKTLEKLDRLQNNAVVIATQGVPDNGND